MTRINNQIYNESDIHLTEKNHLINEADMQFTIARIGQIALTTKNLSNFLNEVCSSVSKTLDTEFVKILELSADQKRFKLICGVGWKPNIVGNTYVNVDYESQAGYTLLQKRPIFVKHFENEKRFKMSQLLKDHNVVSGISVSIPGSEGIYGILGSHSTTSIDFTRNQVNFLHSISNIISATIAQHKFIQKLKDEQSKYNELIDNAFDGIVIYDSNQNIIEVNSKLCEITQYSKKELLKLKIRDLAILEEAKSKPIQQKDLKREKTLLIERSIVKKDGSTIIIEVRARSFPKGNYIGIIRDISERKNFEKELKVKDEALQNIQKMEAIGRLAGGVAHDFNNYLTIIRGYCETLLDEMKDNCDYKLMNKVKQIKNSAENATYLTRELLNFSTHKQNYNLNIVNINEIIYNFEKTLISLIGEKAELIFSLSNNIKGIKTNPDQIHQMLLNLVLNAKDAIKNDGKIEIITKNFILNNDFENRLFKAKSGDYVNFILKDNGSGMSEETKKHIFEPFFTTKLLGEGSGFGLSSIYGFIQNMNGFIEVKSELSKGTTIEIFFPASSSSSEITKRRKQNKRKSKKSKRRKKILIVEDNEDINELLNTFLTKKNFEVISANNGKVAYEIISKNQENIDLLLTDAIMPEMDGFELIDLLVDNNIKLKTIIMSGYSEKSLNKQQSENVSFLQKPFSMDELLNIIENN